MVWYGTYVEHELVTMMQVPALAIAASLYRSYRERGDV